MEETDPVLYRPDPVLYRPEPVNINTIKQRKELFTFFKKTLKKKDPFQILTKKNVLGKGGQGTVYRYCLSKNKSYCTAVKKIYLDTNLSKYINDIYNKKAYKEGLYIELSCMQLTNQLILQKICPNYILNYHFSYKERDGICDDIYPYTMYFYNEVIDNSEVYTDWVKKFHKIELWYNAYFQIIFAIYALQRHFNMTHLDLHSDNVLVVKVKEGGHWIYEIDGIKYYVPNLGYIFYIIDFGHGWIPNIFKSWFITTRYKHKHIYKNFDITSLFKSTLKFSTSPSTFKKHIRYIIKELKGDREFSHLISEIWNNYKKKLPNSPLIDKFNVDKNLNIKSIPKKLQHLVQHK